MSFNTTIDPQNKNINKSSCSPTSQSKLNTPKKKNFAYKGRKNLYKLAYSPENMLKNNNPDTRITNDTSVTVAVNKSTDLNMLNNDSKAKIFRKNIANNSTSLFNYSQQGKKSFTTNHISYSQGSRIAGSVASVAETIKNDGFFEVESPKNLGLKSEICIPIPVNKSCVLNSTFNSEYR